MLFKFLPDGSPLQQQVFDHFQTVALEARAAQAGQRRLSIQAQGRSPRTSSSGAPGHRSTEGSREDSSRTREMTDSESLSGSVPTSPRNPATSSATTDLSELGSRKNAGRRAESPRESALRVEVAGRKPLSNVALVVAELKLELGELREVQQPDPLDQRRRIILSDIDDTLYQSMTGGRKWFADRRLSNCSCWAGVSFCFSYAHCVCRCLWTNGVGAWAGHQKLPFRACGRCSKNWRAGEEAVKEESTPRASTLFQLALVSSLGTRSASWARVGSDFAMFKCTQVVSKTCCFYRSMSRAHTHR